MNKWMTEAARLSVQRAPGLTSGHAHDLADDLYRAWHEDWTPAQAVAWFFAFMPVGWNAEPQRLAA